MTGLDGTSAPVTTDNIVTQNSEKQTLEPCTIVMDPIHQVMELGRNPKECDTIRRVIDTKEFQRLRRISQLGLASFVFPGATHTRFSHCLGACYLADRVLRRLADAVGDESQTKEIEEHNLSVRLAALLHDVGHGPFSHAFEHVLKELPGMGHPPMHEEWTAEIIANEKSEIRRALEKDNAQLIANTFSTHFADSSTTPKLPRFLKEIVSSQIDVDRMDYLARDSHFAGVSVGKIDTYYLINCLTAVAHGKAASTLGIFEKGVKAYEGFVLARQLMNRTLYYHHKVKVFEFMIERLLREVVSKIDVLQGTATVKALIPTYLIAVSSMASKPGKNTADYKREFMERHLADYLELTEDAIWTLVSGIARNTSVSGGTGLANRLSNMLLTRRILTFYAVQPYKEGLLRDALHEAALIEEADFGIVGLITTPYKASDKERVFVQGRDGSVSGITAVSETISVMHDRAEAEYLLVVIDDAKRHDIQRIAVGAQAIRPDHHAKTSGEDARSDNEPARG